MVITYKNYRQRSISTFARKRGAFLFASDYLIKTIQGYDNYIEQKGIDESVMNSYIEACKVAINGEKDIEYELQLTIRSKGVIEQFCMKQTG